jgi:hypothetical protein
VIMWHPMRITPNLLGLAALLALDCSVEAHDRANPKVAEAKSLEESTARIFRAINKNIERRHELVLESLSPSELACNDDGKIQPVECEWDLKK